MSGEPISIKAKAGDEAWVYVDGNGIDIVIRKANEATLSARITMRQLEKMLGVKIVGVRKS